MTYSRGESSSPIHLDKSDIKGLQEISIRAHKEQNLISTHF